MYTAILTLILSASSTALAQYTGFLAPFNARNFKFTLYTQDGKLISCPKLYPDRMTFLKPTTDMTAPPCIFSFTDTFENGYTQLAQHTNLATFKFEDVTDQVVFIGGITLLSAPRDHPNRLGSGNYFKPKSVEYRGSDILVQFQSGWGGSWPVYVNGAQLDVDQTKTTTFIARPYPPPAPSPARSLAPISNPSYIKIWLKDRTEYLSLTEVEIFDRNNVAIEPLRFEASSFSSIYSSQKTNEELKVALTNKNTNGFTHTNLEKEPWIKVYFASEADFNRISKVIAYGRPDSSLAPRYLGLEVEMVRPFDLLSTTDVPKAFAYSVRT